ncbi:SH3 domain-containing protein [uncultured Jannaschia sp.]|uniref:SH3 domain-containing protein n=1 Tax=uncultured Jannaschia sp. TaxID=293347 RepID=UPI0026154EAE|nr:SH3 domain-containing protein [uncultured Jannaschia sp.]
MFTRHSIFAAIMFVLASDAIAEVVRSEPLSLSIDGAPVLIEDKVTGDEAIDYVVETTQPGLLSVDLKPSNPATVFNLLAAGNDTAIFVGSTSGTVADVPVESGRTYIIRTFLMRSAARRNERATYSLAVGFGNPDFADGLSGGPDRWRVTDVGSGGSLNVREGPSTRYVSVSKLRRGEVLQNRGCRMSGETRWCDIRAAGSGVTGWVAGRYLIETAPPPAPETAAGGPIGNGGRFDATGTLPCATAAGQPLRECPFGVIREGPGNAGLWVVTGPGEERYILFEEARPVTSDSSDDILVAREADLLVIHLGSERYEIPSAVVNGG